MGIRKKITFITKRVAANTEIHQLQLFPLRQRDSNLLSETNATIKSKEVGAGQKAGNPIKFKNSEWEHKMNQITCTMHYSVGRKYCQYCMVR